MPLVRINPPVVPPYTDPVLPPAGPPTPTPIGTSGTGSIPQPLAFMITIAIIGIAAEFIGHINEHAAYLFVALVLMGYAGTGGRAEKVLEFANKVSGIAAK